MEHKKERAIKLKKMKEREIAKLQAINSPKGPKGRKQFQLGHRSGSHQFT